MLCLRLAKPEILQVLPQGHAPCGGQPLKTPRDVFRVPSAGRALSL